MFGFVPNGGRLYYLNRSQPPLLADMVLALLDHDATLREGGQQKAKGNAI
jgi:neutral trehalase